MTSILTDFLHFALAKDELLKYTFIENYRRNCPEKVEQFKKLLEKEGLQ